MDYDIFNGDADGICALLQLRKVEPRDATLVTGVKRDINLMAKIDAAAGDRVTVLDVSMDKNKAALETVLGKGAEVFYVDHHFAGEIPENPALTSIINEAPDVCTAALVNGHLRGAQLPWAVAGAFGDNLKDTARKLAEGLDISADDLAALERLGTCINYNGYGPAIEDLHFDPAELYQRLYLADGPLDFVASSPDYVKLSEGYDSDMGQAESLQPEHATEKVAVFILPNEAWARRVSGVYSNDLATGNPGRAHAVVTVKDNGNYLVSVRAPLSNKQGAAELCMKFPTGGGRAAAAGINDLPASELDNFVAAFSAAYG
ncbi:DHH family phosphoesterase [Mangrovimicrobium sediminis]|uniref:DHH family phosphoesterase n=1 Tax=Mangrovimicrobium sediminis TaxID=2562682 RepID=A0A4Z0M5X2_9GAMM|nr:DHH family phosphoesterase [Haliea sp. SAOS-164]TGD74705.1 DHH family phosphoesterase [Haliea sp. SAOS-164]